MKFSRKIFAYGLLATAFCLPAYAITPGCVGKMWNPLTDLDYRLMGGMKILGAKIMPTPSQLGEPPAHKVNATCFCKDGTNTGAGFGLTFWLPSYINDVARQGGCLGFLNGVNVLPSFISESSSQEYGKNTQRVEGATNMQIHWAYADITAIAGKALFEKCNAVVGGMSIAYMTEPDFVYQNDVYSAVMSPQVSLLASAPLLSTLSCGFESVANTLGDWRDVGICAWNGTRLPLSGNSIGKDSAQVTNMDITVKYLTRSAMLGTTLRTMGPDAICRPQYNAFYDPFQHRYQWSYPGKASTRYNVDVVRWGMFMKDSGQPNMLQLTSETASLTNVSPNIPVGGSSSDTKTAPSSGALNAAAQILQKLPKPLNYPTRESGYMQVWEARQCCLKVFTINDAINMVVENLMTGGSAALKQVYDAYNLANKVYTAVTDPIGFALGAIGQGIANGISSAADGIKNSLASMTKK